jgi:excinuclease UvrABC nuclease subunit
MKDYILTTHLPDRILSPKMLGYWTLDQLHDTPDKSGIYCVFRAAPDPETGEMDVQQLLYVGEHRSARYGLEHHMDFERMAATLQPDEELWVAVALCNAYCERLAAAMINAHKPRFNNDSPYRDHFPFDSTTVHIYGKKNKLQSVFNVERTD